MTAKDYPVTFGYKAQDGYWYGRNGRIGLYHRGNDRSTPSGTPIVIGGTTIGLTGNTGATSGAHLHTQAGTDVACQNTINPSSFEFKEGRVVRTRNHDGGAWGKFVTIKVGSRYITYAHLSKVSVEAGQIIRKASNMITKPELSTVFLLHLGRLPDKGAVSHYVGNYTFTFVEKDVRTSTEAKRRRKRQEAIKAANAKKDQIIKSLRAEIDALGKKENPLKDDLAQATARIDQLTNDLERANKEIKLLENTIPEQTEDWNSVISFVVKQVNKFRSKYGL